METSLSEFKVLCGILRKKIMRHGGAIEESHLKLLFATLDDKTIELIYLGPDIVFKIDYSSDRKPTEEVCSPNLSGWRTTKGEVMDTETLAERWISTIGLSSTCHLD